MSRPKRYRVLIVDDHPLVRAGLRSSLARAKDLVIVGEASDGHQAEEMAVQLKPDVVLLDVGLPDRDGIQSARAIKSQVPNSHIVMLTAWEDPDKLIDAVDAGAEGYITKDVPSDRLLAAIRSAIAGDPPISGALALEALRKLGRSRRAADTSSALARLSIRQMEVLRLLAQGLSNKEIAHRLGIAERTVVNHVSAILDQLEVRSRAGAAWVYAHDLPFPGSV